MLVVDKVVWADGEIQGRSHDKFVVCPETIHPVCQRLIKIYAVRSEVSELHKIGLESQGVLESGSSQQSFVPEEAW